MTERTKGIVGWVGTILVTLAIVALATCSVSAAEPSGISDTPRPDWCRPQFVCIPTRDAANLLIRIEELEAQVSVFKATKRRALGYAAVCGPAISLSAEDGNTTFAGTLSCAIGIGYRF